MRRKTLAWVVLVLACLAGLAVSVRGIGEGKILRVGILAARADEDFAGARAFKAHVEEASGGKLQVEIFPSGQFCGNERECLEHLRRGLLAVFIAAPGGLGNAFPPVQVLDMPYALNDDAQAECVVDGPFLGKLQAGMRDADLGFRLMVIGNTGGWRNFATAARPVHHPSDLAGLKLRTTSAMAQQELTRAMGANPTPVPWSEAYTALATGVVDGTKNGIRDIVSARFHEHVRFITLDGHSYMAALWLFSEPVWQSLSPDQRTIVSEGFDLLRDVTRAAVKQGEAAAYARFEAAGGTVIRLSAAARAPFLAKARSVYPWFEARLGRHWIAALENAVMACRNSP